MLRKLTEFILPDKRPPRECEACGASFICGASLKGCWCLQIKLSAEVRQQLRERYKNCLCPDCLKLFAEAPKSTSMPDQEVGMEPQRVKESKGHS